MIRLYCSIGIDLMDSSPWFKFRGWVKMLRQLSQAEASWDKESIGIDLMDDCPLI